MDAFRISMKYYHNELYQRHMNYQQNTLTQSSGKMLKLFEYRNP